MRKVTVYAVALSVLLLGISCGDDPTPGPVGLGVGNRDSRLVCTDSEAWLSCFAIDGDDSGFDLCTGFAYRSKGDMFVAMGSKTSKNVAFISVGQWSASGGVIRQIVNGDVVNENAYSLKGNTMVYAGNHGETVTYTKMNTKSIQWN